MWQHCPEMKIYVLCTLIVLLKRVHVQAYHASVPDGRNGGGGDFCDGAALLLLLLLQDEVDDGVRVDVDDVLGRRDARQRVHDLRLLHYRPVVLKTLSPLE